MEGRYDSQDKKQKKMKKHLKKVVERLPGMEESLLLLSSTQKRDSLSLHSLLSQTEALSKANLVLDQKLKKLQKT